MEEVTEIQPGTDDKTKLEKYKEQLITFHQKGQDIFEQQLSYISAGSLALSIGFIKDIVKNIDNARFRYSLIIGWIFLILTLLLNLVSHLWSVGLLDRSIKEIDHDTYKKETIDQRFKNITRLNWGSVLTLILGISLIVIFVSFNL